MSQELPKYRSGDHETDQLIHDLVTNCVSDQHDLVFEMVVSAIRLCREGATRGDLKLVNSALKELRYSMGVFGPYRDTRKVSIFGSARTQPQHPSYQAAVEFGKQIAEVGWMAITGAGPGIMAAGVEGAGAEQSFGVGISLPFEEKAASTIAEDPKLINFKYFFTRKLTFMKESHGYALLPGGFGTMDESFELLTLLQTGKTYPAPVVLLDEPGGTYWQALIEFVQAQLLGEGMISAVDLNLVCLTDSVEDAVTEIAGFYRNYHSMRFVGRQLVMRLNSEPSTELIDALNTEFGDIITGGKIEASTALEAEVKDNDFVDKARIVFEFNRRDYGRLRLLINMLNSPELAPEPTISANI